ncbi:MAG: hypothetical protein UGF89_08800 [Acutalibacteraceae bacterium]|nr:hypothetical protein [Acutalibacteraceae bacterium]
MKTKKALAVILAVVMLVMPLAVSSFAADNGIVAGPTKTAYNDSEYFSPLGIVISYEGDEIAYTPGDSNFRFTPALNELVTVDTTEVVVYYNNDEIGTVEIAVDHILGELTIIDNGHGKFCLGCGQLHEFEEHDVPEYIPNDDGGFITLQTETGICNVCKAEVTRTIPGSEKFTGAFDTENLTELEAEIIGYIYMILVSLVQAFLSIS